LLNSTGKQLLIEDDDQLLVQMSHKNDIFITGLDRFKWKITYGNLYSDLQVPFETACICPPITDLTAKSFEKCQIYEINTSVHCIEHIEDQIMEEIKCNLDQVEWIRKTIDLSDYHIPHSAIANKGLTTQTLILNDLIKYLTN